MAKIFITGGNGFIGANITREMISRGFEVVSYDIVQPRSSVDGVTYIQGTILDEFQMAQAMDGCDSVFHLAAILGVKRADAQLLRCMTINVEGTRSVLRAAEMAKVPNILFTSSSEIFGDVFDGPLNEISPYNPKSGYAVSKLAGEQYVKGFSQSYDLSYRIIRYFNIYGPGQVAEFVVPRFIKMAQRGSPITVYGEGAQIRSFCHIRDAARATVDLYLEKETENQDFNVGNDLEPITISALAEMVQNKVDTNSSINKIPFADSDRNTSREIFHRVPDISKIKKIIQYSPSISLDSGLDDVIESGDIPDSWVEPLE